MGFQKKTKKEGASLKIQRKEKIIQLIGENRMVKAGQLAEIFQVSSETIRRDLEELEAQKLIRRIHGGAILNTTYNSEPAYSCREIENYEKKILIGRKAADLVKDGDSIVIDIGTTTLEFAKFLKGKKITVFTNSLKIAYELMDESTMSVIILGGRVRHGEGTTSGYWSEEMIDHIYADKLFLGVGAMQPGQGIMDYHMEETNLRRHYLKHCREVIALSDYSKFGISALNLVCETDKIDCLVTDEQIDKKILKELRERGVRVLVA